jgi:hypothetical protein
VSIDPTSVGGGYVGHGHPDTSRQAAAAVKAGSQHAHLLQLVAAAGNKGITCWEAAQDPTWATVRPNITENQIGARMLWLRENGYVAHRQDVNGTKIKRATKTSTALVHVATHAGYIEALRLEMQRAV